MTMTLNLTEAEMVALERLYTPTFVQMLHALRSDEGDSINLLSDNPEGPPNNAVECCGAWTDWEDVRFNGETLEAAVRAAYDARAGRLALQQETKPCPSTAGPPASTSPSGGSVSVSSPMAETGSSPLDGSTHDQQGETHD